MALSSVAVVCVNVSKPALVSSLLGGILVHFPHFALVEQVYDAWKTTLSCPPNNQERQCAQPGPGWRTREYQRIRAHELCKVAAVFCLRQEVASA